MTALQPPWLLALSATLALAACGDSHDDRVPPPNAATYSVAGSITGLTAAALLLQNNGAELARTSLRAIASTSMPVECADRILYSLVGSLQDRSVLTILEKVRR
jgi:hypothetical protein